MNNFWNFFPFGIFLFGIPTTLKGFLGDFVEFEHNEGENDFTKIPVLV